MGDNSLTEPLLPLNQAPTLPALPGCPPGLEYLTHLDQILIHQQVELIEVFTGWETENKYQIKNALGQQIYFAAEESELCMRLCCKSRRGFMMHIIDNLNQEVMRVVRPFQCCAGCCWCADSCDHCALTISVETPGGEQIGHVRQRGSRWKPHFDILDSSFEPVLKIRGPCFRTPCCTEDVNFQLMTYDESQQIGKISKQWAGITKEWFTKADNFGITFPQDLDVKLMTYDESQQIGKISKQWAGITKEWFTKADNFGITFPQDLDVKVKGTFLGALFLIDFMFYEHDKNTKSFFN